MTLTNIICNIVITLLTNTVETDNGVKGCGHLPPEDHKGGFYTSLLHLHEGYPESCRGERRATEKTITTTVTERKEIKFPVQWVNGDLENLSEPIFRAVHRTPIVQDRELSRTVKRYVKSQEWVEVKELPISLTHTNQFVFTNSFVMPTNQLWFFNAPHWDATKATNDLAQSHRRMQWTLDNLRRNLSNIVEKWERETLDELKK